MLTIALLIAVLLTVAILAMIVRAANAEAELIKMGSRSRITSSYQNDLTQVFNEVDDGMIGGVDASDIRGPDVFR